MSTKLLHLLVLSILLSGCCGGQEDFVTNISEEATRLVAYADQQHVQFLSSSGDTIRTVVSRVQQLENQSCAECYCYAVKEERLTVKISKADSVFATIYLTAGRSYLEFDLPDGYLSSAFDTTANIVCDSTLTPPVRCLDSLVVQGIVYKDVYQIYRPGVLGSSLPLRIFYQIKKGLLRIERSNGEIIEVL